jgi:hypothetical protein
VKLRVRRRTAKAALWTGVASGALIAGAAIYSSLEARPLDLLVGKVGLALPIGFAILCVLCAAARMRLRRAPHLAGLALWLGMVRYAVNIAFGTALAVQIPTWITALFLSHAWTSSLLQALLLTLAGFVMTTLSVGCALDLVLLLTPRPEEPAA